MQIKLTLPAVVTLVFVILKLTNVIGWSWWWIFSPLLIVGGLWVAIYLFVLLVALLGTAVVLVGTVYRKLRR